MYSYILCETFFNYEYASNAVELDNRNIPLREQIYCIFSHLTSNKSLFENIEDNG